METSIAFFITISSNFVLFPYILAVKIFDRLLELDHDMSIVLNPYVHICKLLYMKLIYLLSIPLCTVNFTISLS